MIKKLTAIVVDSSTKQGRLFDLMIQSLIVLSIVAFSIETLPNLNKDLLLFLDRFELICVIIFTVEYVLRVFLSSGFKYAFTFFGLIDAIAIIPFYVSTGLDLRSVRVFRLLKLFRLFKMLKYSKSIDRIQQAFNDVKSELIIFFVATGFVLYLSAVGIYYFEHTAQPDQFKSVFHSLWWAVTTLTTVGYGDMYPITAGGKLFSTFIVFIGLGLVAVPSGLLATAFSKGFKKEE
tara:strand:- start:829 stop:1530 length:702 start_codon:yes stop_codon:yes gene_type:complete